MLSQTTKINGEIKPEELFAELEKIHQKISEKDKIIKNLTSMSTDYHEKELKLESDIKSLSGKINFINEQMTNMSDNFKTPVKHTDENSNEVQEILSAVNDGEALEEIRKIKRSFQLEQQKANSDNTDLNIKIENQEIFYKIQSRYYLWAIDYLFD